MEDFALPLPITVICELPGVPYEDRVDFRVWSDAFLSTTEFTADEDREHTGEMAAYMAALIASRRREPTGDLLGALVVARDSEDRLAVRAAGSALGGGADHLEDRHVHQGACPPAGDLGRADGLTVPGQCRGPGSGRAGAGARGVPWTAPAPGRWPLPQYAVSERRGGVGGSC
ncbi:hypothetical protein KCV87_06005 [Actinosynnema pretiosum subsp. pretiosum]|uniref:Uncharacterized protein n=1 Tax=Actinosynnema pretiosum subsp. pretiosum TaxID=103721 RepID=A0AA45LAA4_9PSEU|nr:putative cytochrome P450 hydroxylase [Actinosynnema pretiosum subsp. pretiosum]QUF05650.1 hypothetical protein KCV87_06005 [Actinosynnema pretiosum subsp. pretiosum]